MAITGALLTRKKVVQVGLEPGTFTLGKIDQAVALTTDVLAFDPVIQPTSPFAERSASGKNLGQSHLGLVGEKSGTFACEVELRGNGTNGMDTGLAILLQGCGMLKAAEVYTVTSPPNHKTISIAVYQGNAGASASKKKILYGAMADLELSGEVGRKIICKFDFQGIYDTVVAGTVPTFAPNTNPPPILAGATFTLNPGGGGAVARKISKFSIKLGNKLYLRTDPQPGSAISQVLIVDSDPTMTFDLESELVANDDIYGQWIAGTTAAISLILGTGAGKQITIAIPKLQYKSIPEGDREGIMIEDVTGQCLNTSPDTAADAISISVLAA